MQHQPWPDPEKEGRDGSYRGYTMEVAANETQALQVGEENVQVAYRLVQLLDADTRLFLADDLLQKIEAFTRTGERQTSIADQIAKYVTKRNCMRSSPCHCASLDFHLPDLGHTPTASTRSAPLHPMYKSHSLLYNHRHGATSRVGDARHGTFRGFSALGGASSAGPGLSTGSQV